MAETKLGGNPVHTSGDLPAMGQPAPDFTVVKGDLSSLSLGDLSGQRVVLNIFPSIDTPTCAASVRRFNEVASSLDNTTVLNVSMDLPFAQSRFCGAEGLSNVVNGSDFRDGSFGQAYGVRLVDGPLTGLFARAVVVVGVDGTVSTSSWCPRSPRSPTTTRRWLRSRRALIPIARLTVPTRVATSYGWLAHRPAPLALTKSSTSTPSSRDRPR